MEGSSYVFQMNQEKYEIIIEKTNATIFQELLERDSDILYTDYGNLQKLEGKKEKGQSVIAWLIKHHIRIIRSFAGNLDGRRYNWTVS